MGVFQGCNNLPTMRAHGNHCKLCITANCVPVSFNTTNSEGNHTTVPSLHYKPTNATKGKEKEQKQQYYKRLKTNINLNAFRSTRVIADTRVC